MPRSPRARAVMSFTAGAVLVLSLHPVAAARTASAAELVGRPIAPLGTRRVATPGSILWAETYNGPGNDQDTISSLGVSPDGTKVFVTGGSIGTEDIRDFDYATIAYDASTGGILWLQRYNGPAGLGDHANALGVSPDGTKVFVTGSSDGLGDFSDYATIAYEASTGAMLWVARYDGPVGLSDIATDLGVSADGTTVFATGFSIGSPSGCEFSGAGQAAIGPPVADSPCFDYATIAYDALTGAELWVARYDGPRSLNDEARALRVSADGTKVFVTGVSESFPQYDDYATVAYAATTGNQLWVKRYGSVGPGDDAPTSLDVTPDGTKVFVTGRSWGSNDFDFATVAYGATNGATLWVSRYRGPGNGSADTAESLVTSPDGSRVYVTGGSRESSRLAQFVTISYDGATGAMQWLNSYSRGNSGGRAIGMAPDGRTVFGTGICYWMSSNHDFCTLAIDAASGSRLWESRYNAPPQRDEQVQDLGVSPDGGKVFVAGSTWGMGTSDYATVAHSTT